MIKRKFKDYRNNNKVLDNIAGKKQFRKSLKFRPSRKMAWQRTCMNDNDSLFITHRSTALHVRSTTPSKIKHNVSVCCLTIMSVYFIDCFNLFFKFYLLLIWLVPKLSHLIGGLILSHLIGQHFDCKSSLDMNIFTKDFLGQKWSFLRNEHHEWLVLTSSDLCWWPMVVTSGDLRSYLGQK